MKYRTDFPSCSSRCNLLWWGVHCAHELTSGPCRLVLRPHHRSHYFGLWRGHPSCSPGHRWLWKPTYRFFNGAVSPVVLCNTGQRTHCATPGSQALSHWQWLAPRQATCLSSIRSWGVVVKIQWFFPPTYWRPPQPSAPASRLYLLSHTWLSVCGTRGRTMCGPVGPQQGSQWPLMTLSSYNVLSVLVPGFPCPHAWTATPRNDWFWPLGAQRILILSYFSSFDFWKYFFARFA